VWYLERGVFAYSEPGEVVIVGNGQTILTYTACQPLSSPVVDGWTHLRELHSSREMSQMRKEQIIK
jgi:hypothetical protein